MPIYEYECEDCGHTLETLQKLSDSPLEDCPACSQPKLRKLISAAGFRLKGGGWYETDFKSEGKRNVAETASEKSKSTSSEKKSHSCGSACGCAGK